MLPIELDLQPSARIEFEITDAGIAPMRVEVERLRRGIVRAVTGRSEPAVGSKVEVVVKGTEPFDAASEVQASRGGRAHSFDPSHRFHELTSAGVTDAAGRAEVFVSPTALGVVVRVTGPHPPLVVDPVVFTPGQDLVVVVPEGGGIVGRVLLRGLDPTRVVLHVERTDGEELPHRRLEKATMQADGRFALRGLAPGGYRLRLSYATPFRTDHGNTAGSASLAVNVPDVTVVADRDTATEIDATDHVPASLRGRVLLAGIVPSPARVYLRAASGAHSGQFVPDVYGEFEATGLLPGTYRAWLVLGDFRMGKGDRIAAEDTFTLAAGEHLVRDFTFKR